MAAAKVLLRVVAIAVVLSAIDAVSGRLFQASPNPSAALSLGASAWIAYRLAQDGQRALAVIAGVVMWAAFMSAFIAWATLLIGWNGSVAWQPRSTAWLVNLGAVAVLVAIAAQFAGVRARTSSAQHS